MLCKPGWPAAESSASPRLVGRLFLSLAPLRHEHTLVLPLALLRHGHTLVLPPCVPQVLFTCFSHVNYLPWSVFMSIVRWLCHMCHAAKSTQCFIIISSAPFVVLLSLCWDFWAPIYKTCPAFPVNQHSLDACFKITGCKSIWIIALKMNHIFHFPTLSHNFILYLGRNEWVFWILLISFKENWYF